MARKGLITKVLAIVGTVLVWFPLLAPILFWLISFVQERIFHLDYLMPAELFPSALLGGGLLFWAARRARSRQRLIGWGIVAALILPLIGSVIATTTGLASGETEPGGWQWALVLASLAGYVLALAAVAVGGLLLLRDLFVHNAHTALTERIS